MNRKRLVFLAASAIAVAIPTLVAPPSALAQATLVRSPISFTLSGCTSLPAGLTVQGSGESFTVINHRIDQNGVAHIQMDTITTGNATDSNGATYGFNYHNHVSVEISPGGFPFQI